MTVERAKIFLAARMISMVLRITFQGDNVHGREDLKIQVLGA
jgi:hypothetical protein